MITKLEARR